ncbi:MAG: ABC transporter permease subunit [Thermostichales cyanobacterium SZTDM-1c_bins_54]
MKAWHWAGLTLGLLGMLLTVLLLPPGWGWSLWGSWILVALSLWRLAQRDPGWWPPGLALVATLLLIEGLLRGYGVPGGLIPTPSRVLLTCWTLRELLWRDVLQTFFLEALVGLLIGAGMAGVLALLMTYVPWLQRGLLPYVAALGSVPIPAFAPVMITAFGIDWPSKAAVVAVVVLFPLLLNLVKGLTDIPPAMLDLLHSYHATPWQRLRWVRWPHALPYVFNGLKIAITLAAIAAIAAEFMGSPSYGLGFRIRSEAGRFQFDRVWAAIVYATVGSTALFAAVVALEKRLLFWERR